MKLIKFIFASVFFLGFTTVSYANFTDIDNTELYYKGIIYLQEQGIVSGYQDHTFRPENLVNRAEMLKMVVESKGISAQVLAPFNDDRCFNDVPRREWYTKYVCYAKEQGWIEGYADNTFRPETPINAVESLKIILEVWGIDYEKNPRIWYKGVVERAAQSNYIPFNVSDFGMELRRNQMADMVTRAMTQQEGTLGDYLGVRAKLTANYATIQKAMSHKSWDVDPNNNALILTTILTSQADDEKVFTVLMLPVGNKNDVSLKNIPMQFLFEDEFNTYYYTTSAICILDGTCSKTQIKKIDEILNDADYLSINFALGGNKQPTGCYYVSDFDFSMTFPETWGAIHDFTILDAAHWESHGMTDPSSFVGQGVVCNGDPHQGEGQDLGNNDNRQIRIQGK
ncbi:S-layer homology domain-containing protein [Candidatus Gracilibacteria bacterium]|nr:S-layer homology domain-containing protein [Candidatus Gracilibacteria bacterium]